MIKAKAMSWPKSRAYNKFRRETEASELSREEQAEELINWVLINVYPDLDLETINQADAIELYKQTITLGNQRTAEEEKNSSSLSDGSVNELSIAKTAGK